MSIEDIVRKLGGRIIEVGRDVVTVKQAARELGVEEGQIIKSLVVITEEGPLLAILDGTSRLDLSKLRGRLARPEEVKELTGFEVGEVPPVGIPMRTLIDRKVMERRVVYGGGGSRRRLIEISPERIAEYQGAEITDISDR
ncbi:hypothetical protein D9Q81_07595 [Candidatus Korarchaeum cryptofilum]|jgi:prolyl-tRNA editing enzyme YbaK/EbsC (Cys-tRNA(Pro) deacylase)|uniref:YbaK/aminoacyl-tRNA synthetase-associated domain-containing protein n=1 Tax=Candidatus Korarchaeum cryptofilum TaxID=498846 RepID=A0A3R9PQ40_9CREN|nr:YbaK/EbsC family protein [Candidatus Korarchaeum cryptofilum]RSN67653.1 hypothetical protein D9Q81_07595 [Candidatus Korarchaeum cryptofilum]